MNIYHSTKVMPYVYVAINLITNEFYHGVRWANKVPSTEDIGVIYKTSSRLVKPIVDQFMFIVLAEFLTVEAAGDFEQHLIKVNWDNPLQLNKNLGGIQYKQVGARSAEHIRKLNESRKKNNKRRTWTWSAERRSRAKLDPALQDRMTQLANRKRGVARPESTKMKISLARTGTTQSATCKQAISDGCKGKSKSSKGVPKPKTVCRIYDKAEMNISSYWSWVKRSI